MTYHGETVLTCRCARCKAPAPLPDEGTGERVIRADGVISVATETPCERCGHTRVLVVVRVT